MPLGTVQLLDAGPVRIASAQVRVRSVVLLTVGHFSLHLAPRRRCRPSWRLAPRGTNPDISSRCLAMLPGSENRPAAGIAAGRFDESRASLSRVGHAYCMAAVGVLFPSRRTVRRVPIDIIARSGAPRIEGHGPGHRVQAKANSGARWCGGVEPDRQRILAILGGLVPALVTLTGRVGCAIGGGT
jgi:hypothetical protein